MNKNYYCVIMAGGIGARFWPMSRTSRPKQFIDILGTGETLIQQTFRRLSRICPPENILVVTHELYRDLVLAQLPGIRQEHILCEPVRRNTAPCIAYACYKISKLNPDACIVVAPSDHVILKEDQFHQTLMVALKAAEENKWLLTLGIMPNRPDTGYGYIQFDDSVTYGEEKVVRKVKTFTEKPHYELAVSFLQSGDFLWNSGIFIWSNKSILKAIGDYLPDLENVFREGVNHYYTPSETAFVSRAYTLCNSISIDYGIMEKATNVYVIPSDFGWSDLGTWGSLYEARQKDENGNTATGEYAYLPNTSNTIVTMPHGKIAVIEGLDDYIVVDDSDVLLICRRSEEQHIREFVDKVRLDKGDTYV